MNSMVLEDKANIINNQTEKNNEKWKILIVDDEKDVHTVTRFALDNYVYKGKILEFISAYSGTEAKNCIREHLDTAVVLLDVVMEEDDAGLKLVEYIRKEVRNTFVRIILRTGHPGYAPEDEVMFRYDINDYKDKTELTNKKFITTITSALSNYSDIMTIESYRKSLSVSESKYRYLLENLPQRIFYKNKNLVYVSCNKYFAGDLKMKQEEIEGKTDFDLFPPELAVKYRFDDKRILETGNAEDIEEKYITEGSELLVHTVKTPLKDDKGNIVGILGIFWDITEKRMLELEAIHSRQLASLGELAAGVAHEINNPVNGVMNWAQLLHNRSKEGSEERKIADWIMKESSRISNMVRSLLSLARHSGKKEEKRTAYLHEILSETLILTEAQLLKEGITIKNNLPPGLPGIKANFQEIRQVFLNILINARYALNQKYPDSHSNKILEITGKKTTMNDKSYVKIEFYDRGAGIPAKIINKVKDPFFTIKPKGEGTGLGLSISNNIIKDHGGTLNIESVEGEYTKAIIHLPVGH